MKKYGVGKDIEYNFIHREADTSNTIDSNNMVLGIDEYLPKERRDRELKELYYIFLRMKQTGFVDEEFETDGGDVDHDDYSFDSLGVDSTGFYITKPFLKFYDMVLKMEE